MVLLYPMALHQLGRSLRLVNVAFLAEGVRGRHSLKDMRRVYYSTRGKSKSDRFIVLHLRLNLVQSARSCLTCVYIHSFHACCRLMCCGSSFFVLLVRVPPQPLVLEKPKKVQKFCGKVVSDNMDKTIKVLLGKCFCLFTLVKATPYALAYFVEPDTV